MDAGTNVWGSGLSMSLADIFKMKINNFVKASTERGSRYHTVHLPSCIINSCSSDISIGRTRTYRAIFWKNLTAPNSSGINLFHSTQISDALQCSFNLMRYTTLNNAIHAGVHFVVHFVMFAVTKTICCTNLGISNSTIKLYKVNKLLFPYWNTEESLQSAVLF